MSDGGATRSGKRERFRRRRSPLAAVLHTPQVLRALVRADEIWLVVLAAFVGACTGVIVHLMTAAAQFLHLLLHDWHGGNLAGCVFHWEILADNGIWMRTNARLARCCRASASERRSRRCHGKSSPARYSLAGHAVLPAVSPHPACGSARGQRSLPIGLTVPALLFGTVCPGGRGATIKSRPREETSKWPTDQPPGSRPMRRRRVLLRMDFLLEPLPPRRGSPRGSTASP